MSLEGEETVLSLSVPRTDTAAERRETNTQSEHCAQLQESLINEVEKCWKDKYASFGFPKISIISNKI